MLAEIYGLLPGALAWMASLSLIRCLWATPFWFLGLIAAPLVLCTVLTVVLTILRLILPRLLPGSYRLPGPARLAFHLALGRSAEIFRILPLLRSSYVLRFFYFRALGLQMPISVNCALDSTMTGASLIRIGNSATISFQSLLTAVHEDHDQVILGEVVLGSNVFLGARSVLGPNSRLGDGAWIGLGNRMRDRVVAPGERIENYVLEKGES